MSRRDDNLPAWIQEKLFENVLRETVDNFSKVLSFKAFNALAPGENYATVMVKIEAEVLLENDDICKRSFMLKVAHDSEFYRKEMTRWNMFATEAGMYQEVVPELENLYNKIGKKIKFGAQFYKLPIEEDYILLENLLEKGFRNAPRQECLDIDHCRSVLKKLAQWHAASAVRIEQIGPYKHDYAKGMLIESGKGVFKTMLDSAFRHLLNSLGHLANIKVFLSELVDLKDHITDLFYLNTSFDENEFRVLNHGDCWSNNIMFQYNSAGNLRETYFVDLQIPSYGSPAQDLLYFIFTSAQLDIKINKFNYMIKYYHDNLVEHLKLLKYQKPLPTLKELHISLLRHGQWGFFATLVTLPAVLCDPTDKASVDNLIGDCQEADKFKQLMYTNQRYLDHIEVILPWLCYRGALRISG